MDAIFSILDFSYMFFFQMLFENKIAVTLEQKRRRPESKNKINFISSLFCLHFSIAKHSIINM